MSTDTPAPAQKPRRQTMPRSVRRAAARAFGFDFHPLPFHEDNKGDPIFRPNDVMAIAPIHARTGTLLGHRSIVLGTFASVPEAFTLPIDWSETP